MTSSINGCVYSYQTTMRKILFWGLTKQSPCLSQVVRRVLGLFLIEPHQMIKIAALTFLGCKRKIHWFGLNPQTLTAEQASAVPLLLIHGRMHNQGIWISLAKAVR
jgi:hypothetical protein